MKKNMLKVLLLVIGMMTVMPLMAAEGDQCCPGDDNYPTCQPPPDPEPGTGGE